MKRLFCSGALAILLFTPILVFAGNTKSLARPPIHLEAVLKKGLGNNNNNNNNNNNTIPKIFTAENQTAFTFNGTQWRFVHSDCKILDCSTNTTDQIQFDRVERRDDSPEREQSEQEQPGDQQNDPPAPRQGPEAPWAIWEVPWEELLRRYSYEVLGLRPAYYQAIEQSHVGQARIQLFEWFHQTRLSELPEHLLSRVSSHIQIELHYVVPPAMLWIALVHGRDRGRHKQLSSEQLMRLDASFRTILNDVNSNFHVMDSRLAALREMLLLRAVRIPPTSYIEQEPMVGAYQRTIYEFKNSFPWHSMTRDEAKAIRQVLSGNRVPEVVNSLERAYRQVETGRNWDFGFPVMMEDMAQDIAEPMAEARNLALFALASALNDFRTRFRPDWHHYYIPKGGQDWPRPAAENWNPHLQPNGGNDDDDDDDHDEEGHGWESDAAPDDLESVHSIPFTGGESFDSPRNDQVDGPWNGRDLPQNDENANNQAFTNWLDQLVKQDQQEPPQSEQGQPSSVSREPSASSALSTFSSTMSTSTSTASTVLPVTIRPGSVGSNSGPVTPASEGERNGHRGNNRARMQSFLRGCRSFCGTGFPQEN